MVWKLEWRVYALTSLSASAGASLVSETAACAGCESSGEGRLGAMRHCHVHRCICVAATIEGMYTYRQSSSGYHRKEGDDGMR